MSARVVILGGGVAGLTTALLLARGGVRVDVLERDRAPAPFGRRTAAGWVRDGTPQVQHAHVFDAGCHRLLADTLPDVLGMLFAAGARQVPIARSDPALAVRRPLFDWVLRRVAEREPGVRVHGGTAATGLRIERSRLTGVQVPGGVLAADVAVDATGAHGAVSGWLADIGHPKAPPAMPARTYFSRGYALCWPGDPGELNLGAAAGGVFDGYRCRAVPGDNNTVTVTFAIPSDRVGGLAALRMPDAFQAAAEMVPLVADWVDPGTADPLTGVGVLADWPAPAIPGLAARAPDLPGLVAVGDARGVGDPEACNGVRLALAHAMACAAAVLEGGPDLLATLPIRIRDAAAVATGGDVVREPRSPEPPAATPRSGAPAAAMPGTPAVAVSGAPDADALTARIAEVTVSGAAPVPS